MFDKVLFDWTKVLLQKLTPKDFPEDTYLGGGTAIALQLGHRRSIDLDFFTPTRFVELQWEQYLEERFNFHLKNRDKQTLDGEIGKVKLSLLGYTYKLIGDLEKYYEVPLASLPDLAAMKLNTVVGRGSKRDLIDIYFLAKQFSLPKLFDFYDKKFENLDERELMIKKGLIYFDAADKQYMPDMLVKADWKEIKKWFVEEVRKM